MSDFDFQGPPEEEWNERGELAWNEFDWERYLREQDETIQRYLALYEACRREPDRIDVVAERMGWEQGAAEGDGTDEAASADDENFVDDTEIYTLHRNPVFVATKAIYLSLRRPWQILASSAHPMPASLAVAYLSALGEGEEQALQAIHALDFGDFAMAVSLFKRALAGVNRSLALLEGSAGPAVAAYRDDAVPRLFDLREIWLRIIQECREELGRGLDEET